MKKKTQVTVDTEEFQRIIKSFFKNQYSRKLENMREMQDCLDKQLLPKLNQESVNYMEVHNP